MTRILTPRECVKESIGHFVLDFRRWLTPDTMLLGKWKSQAFAYSVAEGKMINDFNKMLNAYRKKSSELPMLILAVKQVAAPPDVSQLIGVPYEINTVIKADPLKRHVKLRTEPATYHVQFVFISNDPDSANSFTTQFCSYIRLMEKRRIYARFFLEPNLRDNWHLTILDNSIFPDSVDLEEDNLHAGLLDFEFVGLVPRILAGMPPLYESEFTDGYGGQADGTGGNGEGWGNGGSGSGSGGSGGGTGNGNTEVPPAWDVVVEGELFKDRDAPDFVRVKVDMQTGERTDEIEQKSEKGAGE